MADKVRYSDEELEEFRAIINEKLTKAMGEYEHLRQILTNEGNDTTDTANAFKALEEGAYTLAKEEAARLAERQRVFINKLQAALTRIDNKTYGVCRVTGKLIPKERLRLVPHATTSVEGKEKLNK